VVFLPEYGGNRNLPPFPNLWEYIIPKFKNNQENKSYGVLESKKACFRAGLFVYFLARHPLWGWLS